MNMPKGFYAAQWLFENQLPDDGEAEEARVAAWQQHCLERSDGSTLAMILNQEYTTGEVTRYPDVFDDINRTVKLLAEELVALDKASDQDRHVKRLISFTHSIAESYAMVEGADLAAARTEWPPLINLWRNK